MSDFKDRYGQVALVTGASSGLCRGTGRSRRLTSRLVLVARRADRLEALAASLPVRAKLLPVDLAQADAPRRMLEATAGQDTGRVNALGEGLWAELRPEGIEVLTICPGATESEAASKQGIDIATLRNVMPAREVARASLDNLAEGPTFFPSAFYRLPSITCSGCRAATR